MSAPNTTSTSQTTHCQIEDEEQGEEEEEEDCTEIYCMGNSDCTESTFQPSLKTFFFNQYLHVAAH